MTQRFELHPDNPQPRLLRQAAEILRKGGVIVMPTDASPVSVPYVVWMTNT